MIFIFHTWFFISSRSCFGISFGSYFSSLTSYDSLCCCWFHFTSIWSCAKSLRGILKWVATLNSFGGKTDVILFDISKLRWSLASRWYIVFLISLFKRSRKAPVSWLLERIIMIFLIISNRLSPKQPRRVHVLKILVLNAHFYEFFIF